MEDEPLGGRYRLGPVIGAGGSGSVHRARDLRTGRDVAIKLLRSPADAVACERLRREAEYLGRVHHPNLVAILDAGAEDDGTWFAMELVAGPDLRSLLRDRGRMEGVAVRRILTGVLAALGALHDAGLVHRDVTPANILLTADPFARWEAVLTDLGIAQRLHAVPLTDAGRVIGTATYLSPEQVAGGEVGPATDVYAVALVALEALTGRVAIPGGPIESATARLVRPPSVPEGLAPPWRELLAAATSVDAAARPSVAAFARAVRSLPDDAGTLPDPGPAPAPAPARRTAVSTALMAAPSTAVLPIAAPLRRHASPVLVALAALLLITAGGGTTALALSQRPVATVAERESPEPTATPTAGASTPAAVDAAAPEAPAAPAPPAGPDQRGPAAGGPGAGPP